MRLHRNVCWLLLLLESCAAQWKVSAKEHANTLAGETLRQVLTDHTVVIFSKASCSASHRVKGYFEDLGIPYYALELDQRVDGEALQKALGDLAGSKRTPTVYIRGVLVGGSYDIGRAFKSGELKHWTEADAQDIITGKREL